MKSIDWSLLLLDLNEANTLILELESSSFRCLFEDIYAKKFDKLVRKINDG
jgi:hypothetical protein